MKKLVSSFIYLILSVFYVSTAQANYPLSLKVDNSSNFDMRITGVSGLPGKFNPKKSGDICVYSKTFSSIGTVDLTNVNKKDERFYGTINFCFDEDGYVNNMDGSIHILCDVKFNEETGFTLDIGNTDVTEASGYEFKSFYEYERMDAERNGLTNVRFLKKNDAMDPPYITAECRFINDTIAIDIKNISDGHPQYIH